MKRVESWLPKRIIICRFLLMFIVFIFHGRQEDTSKAATNLTPYQTTSKVNCGQEHLGNV